MGDKYFNFDYPARNLVRTRCQIAPTKDAHKKLAIKRDTFQAIGLHTMIESIPIDGGGPYFLGVFRITTAAEKFY